ncbi:nucleotidyltransferase domain-containing protein [Geoglobus acetivorans]|uniref:Nucleotidyltransferase domain-containing protein n=1 Tax=Geoglobus acetivorans TaxID=565033 RepID=A0ABZ3H1D2_GEOAI|nr:nucleotidyltransferase domain-containing protein [Geoglobus acetivorans]
MDRDDIKNRIKNILKGREEVIFAYLHGSFGEAHFRDVDVAVFVDEGKVKDFIQYEVELSIEIEKSVKLPVDVRVLNSAPLSFKYRAIRGELLLSRDDELRFRFMEEVIREYLDFKPVEERMIREILSM